MHLCISLSLRLTALALSPVSVTAFQCVGSHGDFPPCGVRYFVHSFFVPSQAILLSSEADFGKVDSEEGSLECGEASMEVRVGCQLTRVLMCQRLTLGDSY